MTIPLAVRSLGSVVCSIAVAACGDLTGTEADAPIAPIMAGAAAQQATYAEFGDFAIHIPANVRHVRGILLALGGPNTQGFAGGPSFGAPPMITPLLQDLGVRLRELAAERGLAIVGSKRFAGSAYPNTPASDEAILAGIAEAANLTGRNELLDAPILIFGISAGGPEAVGFTQRNPDRVLGVFLKVPVPAGTFTGAALGVPGHLLLAQNDVVVNNALLAANFAANRAAGAPWSMSIEPGVPHMSLGPAQRDLILSWMKATLERGKAGPFRGASPQVGFLGDPATGEIVPVRQFTGNLSTASWFPTRPLATQWAAFNGW